MRTLAIAVIAVAASTGMALAQDAAAGEQVFKRLCMPCHDIGPGAKVKLGPPLNDIDGRHSGTYDGFNYSPANKNSGITWNHEAFDKYIRAPMQVMPGTWSALRARLHLGDDPYDPRDNILAGTAYLRLMYDRFGYPGLFAAYNAGPGRYAAYADGRVRLPAETIAYLAMTSNTGIREPASPVSAPVALFFVRHDAPPGTAARPSMLFVMRQSAAN